MPAVELSSDKVVVRLSALEKLGALHGDVHIPLAQLARAESTAAVWQDRPWRGIRVGTGLPRAILLGRLLSWNGSTDFCAVYGSAPALVLHLLPGAPFRLVVATAADALALARHINAALPPDAAAATAAAQVDDNEAVE